MSEQFRFNSRREYEAELKRILAFKIRKRRKGEQLEGYTSENIEDEYDKLVDEYLRFCAK